MGTSDADSRQRDCGNDAEQFEAHVRQSVDLPSCLLVVEAQPVVRVHTSSIDRAAPLIKAQIVPQQNRLVARP
jgi:hypothetical protein